MTREEKARNLIKELGIDSVEDLIAILQSVSENPAKEENQTPAQVVSIEEESELSLEIKVKAILRRMGAPANIKGYQYMADALVTGLKNKESLDAVTKLLYPGVAEKNHTTGSRVERAIRHFVEVLYDRGNYEEIDKVVGTSVSLNKIRPTNSEFICAFVDYLKMGGE